MALNKMITPFGVIVVRGETQGMSGGDTSVPIHSVDAASPAVVYRIMIALPKSYVSRIAAQDGYFGHLK